MYLSKSITLLAAFAALPLVFQPATSVAGKPSGGDGGGSTLEYVIHQLDSDGGSYSGFAMDVSEFSVVVGEVADTVTGEKHAAHWGMTVDSDGTVTSSLSLLPGSSGTRATGVNNHGEVVGDAPLLGGPGLYWASVTDQPLPLLPLNGDSDALPRRINDDGIICGTSMYYEFIEGQPNIQEQHPVVWRVTSDTNGNPVVVGPFALPSTYGDAWDLSEADANGIVTVTGKAWDGQSNAAVTWRSPTAIEWRSFNRPAADNSSVRRERSGHEQSRCRLWRLECPGPDRHAVDRDRTDSSGATAQV